MRTQKNKRVVSKARYVTFMGFRFAAGIFFVSCYILGAVGTIIITPFMIMEIFHGFPNGFGEIASEIVMLAFCLTTCVLAHLHIRDLIHDSKKFPLPCQVVLKTPEKESLVRAASVTEHQKRNCCVPFLEAED